MAGLLEEESLKCDWTTRRQLASPSVIVVDEFGVRNLRCSITNKAIKKQHDGSLHNNQDDSQQREQTHVQSLFDCTTKLSKSAFRFPAFIESHRKRPHHTLRSEHPHSFTFQASWRISTASTPTHLTKQKTLATPSAANQTSSELFVWRTNYLFDTHFPEAHNYTMEHCSSPSDSITHHHPINMETLAIVDDDGAKEVSVPRSTSSSSLSDLTASPVERPYSLRRRPRSFSDFPLRPPQSEHGTTSTGSPSLALSPGLITSPKTAFLSPRLRARRILARRSRWLIPSDHPLKIFWDVCTILLSLVYIYLTHTSIRDRTIRQSNFGLVCDAWFLVDILLNFVTEYRTEEGTVLRQGQAVWARYLTSWFVVDALSLVPWESLYVKPIIEMQNKRHFVKKYFLRTRATIRVTRLLRGRHFRLFGKVARQTKHAGVGARRLLRLLIKYVPKYLLFYRNMKGVLAVRLLRQIHWLRKGLRNFMSKGKKQDDATLSLTLEDDEHYHFDECEDDEVMFVEIQYNEHDLSMDDYDDDDGIGLY